MTTSFISIDGRKIGRDFPPYIVAELSANHNGSLERAFRIIESVKKAGADAIKLQTYLPNTMTIETEHDDFQIKKGRWKGQSLYQLYQNAHLPWHWHQALFDKAKALNLTIFSSAFDSSSVAFLENLAVPAYKIASFELVDLALIKCAAKTGKPLILSTGMANKEEIQLAVDTAKEAGCKKIILLHCISSYPAPTEAYHLTRLTDMQKDFGLLTGLSDHSLNHVSAIAAVALGACMIEKHVTLNKHDGGTDDSFSLEPAEFSDFCFNVKQAWQALGKGSYQKTDAEKDNIQFRRSLYVVQDIAKGEVLTQANIRSVRPGFGIAPKFYEQMLGKTAKHALKKGSPLLIKDVE